MLKHISFLLMALMMVASVGPAVAAGGIKVAVPADSDSVDTEESIADVEDEDSED